MRPLELALQYMAAFYGDAPLESMRALLADNLIFTGPFNMFNSAQSYMHSLTSDPPRNVRYQLLAHYENGNSACLIYRFIKPGVNTPMAQIFETDKDKIQKITLIFDTKAFD